MLQPQYVQQYKQIVHWQHDSQVNFKYNDLQFTIWHLTNAQKARTKLIWKTVYLLGLLPLKCYTCWDQNIICEHCVRSLSKQPCSIATKTDITTTATAQQTTKGWASTRTLDNFNPIYQPLSSNSSQAQAFPAFSPSLPLGSNLLSITCEIQLKEASRTEDKNPHFIYTHPKVFLRPAPSCCNPPYVWAWRLCWIAYPEASLKLTRFTGIYGIWSKKIRLSSETDPRLYKWLIQYVWTL